jgi:molybdopterin synthase sulfur carrier subunit
MATIRFFAAAADVVGADELMLEVVSVGDLRHLLENIFGTSASRVISKCSVLVGGIRAELDDVAITASDVVDVLPPFAGG